MKNHTIQNLSFDRLVSSYGVPPKSRDMNIYYHNETTDLMRNDKPHRQDKHVIFIIISGRVIMRIGDDENVFEKNDLLCITPNTIRQILAIEEGTKAISVSFTDEFLFSQAIYKNNIYPLDSFNPNSTYRLSLPNQDAEMIIGTLNLLNIKNTCKITHPYGREVILHDFNSLIFEIAALYKLNFCGIKSQTSRKEEIYARYLNLLPANFKEQRSLKFYAGQLFITRNYLTKIVKETSGKTAGDLIDEMLIIEAKVLLHHASLSITEIADQLIFSDIFMFSKFFKKQTGYSPSSYRKTSMETITINES